MNTPNGNRRRARQERALQRARSMSGVTLSGHAAMRAGELGFHETEVLDCVRYAEQTYCAHPSYGPNRRVHQRGDCACVVDLVAQEVVTVLLRTPNDWSHGLHTRRHLAMS